MNNIIIFTIFILVISIGVSIIFYSKNKKENVEIVKYKGIIGNLFCKTELSQLSKCNLDKNIQKSLCEKEKKVLSDTIEKSKTEYLSKNQELIDCKISSNSMQQNLELCKSENISKQFEVEKNAEIIRKLQEENNLYVKDLDSYKLSNESNEQKVRDCYQEGINLIEENNKICEQRVDSFKGAYYEMDRKYTELSKNYSQLNENYSRLLIQYNNCAYGR
jgi:hypothetical protein